MQGNPSIIILRTTFCLVLTTDLDHYAITGMSHGYAFPPPSTVAANLSSTIELAVRCSVFSEGDRSQ